MKLTCKQEVPRELRKVMFVDVVDIACCIVHILNDDGRCIHGGHTEDRPEQGAECVHGIYEGVLLALYLIRLGVHLYHALVVLIEST